MVSSPPEPDKRALLASEKFLVSAHAERTQAMQFLKDYGQETLKNLVLLHGGSIVAVLTFLGTLFSKGEPAQLRIAAATLNAVMPALVLFGLGLVFAVAASALAYVNFSAHAEIAPDAGELYRWSRGEMFTERPPRLFVVVRSTSYLALGAGCLSLAVFLIGAWIVADSGFSTLEQRAWLEGAPVPR